MMTATSRPCAFAFSGVGRSNARARERRARARARAADDARAPIPFVSVRVDSRAPLSPELSIDRLRNASSAIALAFALGCLRALGKTREEARRAKDDARTRERERTVRA